MAVRVTSSVLEVLAANTATTQRVTSSVLEGLTTNADPPIRVTSSVLEILHGAYPPIRTTFSALEVLLQDNSAIVENYITVTQAEADADLEFPWEFTTEVGAVIGDNINFPWEHATQTLLAAWSDGSFESAPTPSGPMSLTTVTGVRTDWGQSPPLLAWFSTITGNITGYNLNVPLYFETVTGNRTAHTILIDGRRDLIDTRLYKR